MNRRLFNATRSATAAIVLMLGLQPVLGANPNQCVPVKNFITLGENAEKCISEIRLGKQKANDVLANYGFCTNVRSVRDDVEKKISQLPPAMMNRCAEQNLQAYTDAATAIQRLYQIELQLQ
jgi:hypothetical protein